MAQTQLQLAHAENEGLEGQVRQQRQRLDQLLSSLTATVDISPFVLDTLGATEERPGAFSGALQQLCSQVPA